MIMEYGFKSRFLENARIWIQKNMTNVWSAKRTISWQLFVIGPNKYIWISKYWIKKSWRDIDYYPEASYKVVFTFTNRVEVRSVLNIIITIVEQSSY